MTSCSATVSLGNQPTDECLAAAAQHVAHDLELLQLAWAERHTRLGWTLWFILARSLSDFFFEFERKKRRGGVFQDDILAVDFPASGPWRDVAEPILKSAGGLPEWPGLRDAVNKTAAHLTYSRIDAAAAGHGGPSEGIHRLLAGTATVWRERLSPTARAWFGQ